LLLRSQKISAKSLEDRARQRLRIDRTPGHWSKMDVDGRDWTDRLEKVRRMGLERRCLGKSIKNELAGGC
jgi:hypothetical protein